MLSNAGANIGTTVEEGITELATLCSVEMKIEGHGPCVKVPAGGAKINELPKALNVRIPSALPHPEVKVVTRKKPVKHRRTH